jgi:hypothetical protein
VFASEVRLLDGESALKKFLLLVRLAKNTQSVSEIHNDGCEIGMRNTKRSLSATSVMMS